VDESRVNDVARAGFWLGGLLILYYAKRGFIHYVNFGSNYNCGMTVTFVMKKCRAVLNILPSVEFFNLLVWLGEFTNKK